MKKTTIILTILMVVFSINYTEAISRDASSTVYDILKNNTTVERTGLEVLNSILNKKDDVKIKVITDEKELKDESTKNMNDYVKGVDVSKWNGDVDYSSLKNKGIKFVIIRAGYGTTVDYMFFENIKGAIENDMQIGIYWFSYAYTNEMVIREANKCNKTISKYKDYINLPIFYDFEYDSVNYALRNGHSINKSKASSMADSFCNTMKSHGYESGIYTNIDYARRYFTQDVLNKYHTWIAQWSNICTYKDNYIMWQVSDRYYVNNKRFDLNYFYFNRYEK